MNDYNSEDFNKLLSYLEKQSVTIKNREDIVTFRAYNYSANLLNDKQWVVAKLTKLGKNLNIHFYSSIVQVRFVLNGVELPDEMLNPFRDRIATLHRYFVEEWKMRVLNSAKNQI